MAEKDRMLSQLFETTFQIRTDLIQDIMHKAREQSKLNSNPDREFWDQITEKLWKHLISGFKKFDDQLLCATCFYTIIRFSNKSVYYFDEVLQVIEKELIRRHSYNVDEPKTALAVSMMYGLFQSPFLTQQQGKNFKEISTLLRVSFNLLVQIAYEYTQYTFIVFKTIKTFKKVCDTELQGYIFDKDNQIRLLNLVNHNWENPITGIRDQIKAIFQTLISTVDKEMYTKILEEIDGFYWNKAKYLMLSEIIQYSNDIPIQILEKKLVNGLIYSLYKPGLVSAGADMYYAVLKTIHSEQKWCDLFLDSIMQIFKEPSIKSIENFSNYWCLTTLKTFPKLIYIILDEAECTKNNENYMFNLLCIMKQGNKLGLLDNNHKSKVMILQGLEDINPKNRMIAFDIVCVIQGKMLPTEQDYQLILQFLYNNINTDCTVLRLGMLGSINYFLIQLHVLFLNNTIGEEDASIEELVRFCRQLQEFFISSLVLNGNYQRKITCVKLCNIFINTLSEVHRKKRDQTKQAKKLLVEFLIEKRSWLLSEQEFVMKLLNLLRDPADDIRENTRKLFLNHYCNVIKNTTIFNNLIENALMSMKSKFFYEISCGQTMFRLICNLLLKYEVKDGIFTNIDDIFYFAKSELLTEFTLQRNIIESIDNGKQMHSFISILLVILETCIYHSRKLAILDCFVHELLNILEGVINRFSWDHKKSTSSDFSKMNDMVQDIIINSGRDLNEYDDQTKTSGIHQIVLNCLWLNVKASCDLAAVLVQYYTDNNNYVCKKCLNLITYVLETSRHKGVIEAAGTALGRSIQHLTCVSENSEISELPMILLKTKLDEMMSDPNKMSSITRRGAGLSIMVHRIVSSDMRKDKPLFHLFMKTLLRICNEVDDIPTMIDKQNLEDQNDLPKALYIHFLTRIVTDSSLASDMMYYSTELSTLAINQLINPHWQIRNAALQLYGALIPKLVGQNKPSGTEDETIATVACDELRTHSPELWAYILKILQISRAQTDLLLTHSNFVPILNMLANSAKRYNFSYDMDSMNWEKQLLQNLVTLLGSPIFTVRRLTAKCIFNIYTFDDIFDTIFSLEYMSENLLNGALMLVEICHRYYSLKYHNQFKILQEKFAKVLASGSHYYPSIKIYENVFCIVDLDQKQLDKTFLEVYQNKQAPGIFLWAHNRIKKFIMKASWDQILILKTVQDQSDFEKCCEFICEKLEVNIELSEPVVKELVQIMISFKNNKSSSLIWKILFQVSLKFDLSPYIDVPKLIENLARKDIYKLRYIIPLIATLILNINEVNQIKFVMLVSSLSDPDNADVDMRHIAIISNNEIAKIFYDVNDSVRVTAIKTAVVFLQDEDDDLRSLSTHFYKNLIKAQSTVHAFLCLNKILDPEFLATLFDNPQVAVKKLCKDLDEVIKSNMICYVDDYNPFANNTKNIYLEVGVLETFILKIKNKYL
ncbi:hypothetical protein K1T71_008302 [Dendrolimus kikuchii]|uniref:Uncharacterized protein n=1 Tax=Dendrolimus kikuchii TaxID=765133 RepID=A0ACC1CXQ8_9NEOP|nr:hypothetical protein K1T71_008302 [Dendrolimus kikuchii]